MLTELDPVPFPGGAEAALEFAAFEKGLLERGNGRSSARSREPPAARRTPISEPNRHAVHWMLAGAGMGAAVALLLLLLSSGLLTGVVAAALRVAARS